MKHIRLSKHALENLLFRGATEVEVLETIRESEWMPAERDRLECRKGFEFNNIWNGKFYKWKIVRPIFVDEATEIVVITVYVYFNSEERNAL